MIVKNEVKEISGSGRADAILLNHADPSSVRYSLWGTYPEETDGIAIGTARRQGSSLVQGVPLCLWRSMWMDTGPHLLKLVLRCVPEQIAENIELILFKQITPHNGQYDR
jgi:hypothetical protein